MTDRDSEVYVRQQFGNKIGAGRNPALLVVDFVNGFNDPEMFGGGNINSAIMRTVEILAAARAKKIPVVMTRIVYADNGSDAGIWTEKAPRLRHLTENARASQIVTALEPQTGEHILRKKQASAFLGTGLEAWLLDQRIDTLFVAGCTTSGCVRASVVDAVGLNFRPIVIRDCVGDRAIGPHNANLFDMEQKYADVVDLGEALRLLS